MSVRTSLAIVLALLTLVGRWNPGRLFGGSDTVDDEFAKRTIAALWLEPRLWLVVISVALVTAMETGALGSGRREWDRREARTSVRLFFIFALYIIATSAWSPSVNPLPAIVDLLLVLATLWVFERAGGHPRFVETFWGWLERLLLGFAAYALIVEIQQHSVESPDRLALLGGGPNILARFFGMLFLLMVAQSLNQVGRLRWTVGWRVGVAALALILLLQTGSRGGLVGLVIGLMALLAIRRMNMKSIVIGGTAVLLSGYLFSLMANPGMIEFFNERWLVETLQDRYLSNRDVFASEAYRLWLDHALFGGGTDSFEYYTAGLARYPHNLVLEVAQTGGLVAVAVLFVWSLHLVMNVKQGRDLYTEIGLSMTALIFGCALFSGDLYDSRLVFVFGVLSLTSGDLLRVNSRATGGGSFNENRHKAASANQGMPHRQI